MKISKVNLALLSIAFTIASGCTSVAALDDTDRTQTLVLQCPDGMAQCYADANKACGPRGFDEVDRARTGNMTSGGRLDDQGDGRYVYREDVRFEQDQQILAVRCR